MKNVLLLSCALFTLVACAQEAPTPKVEPTQTLNAAEGDVEFTLLGQVEGCNIYGVYSLNGKGVIPICKTDIVVDPLAKEAEPQIPTWDPVPNRGSK